MQEKHQNMVFETECEKFPQFLTASASHFLYPVTEMFRLCLSENYFIMFKPEGASIYSRSKSLQPEGIQQEYFFVHLLQPRKQDQDPNILFDRLVHSS